MLGNFGQDSELLVLDKRGDITFTVVRNIKVTNQYPDTTGKYPIGTMLMDVQGDDGVNPVILAKIPAGRVSHEYDNVFVTDSRELVQKELQAMQSKADNIIDNMPYYQKVSAKCRELIPVVNPQIAKQIESDERISRLEEQFRQQNGDIADIKTMLASFLSKQPTKTTEHV